MNRERRISAAAICAQATAAGSDPADDSGAVRVEGATIEGLLDLSGAPIAVPLVFVQCHFEQPLIVRGAALHSLFLGGCELPEIDGDELHLSADFQVCEGTRVAESIRLSHAQIGGSLSCTGSTISGTNGAALIADEAQIGDHLILSNGFVASGIVSMRRARIGGMLYCSYGRFEDPSRERGERASPRAAAEVGSPQAAGEIQSALIMDDAEISGNAIISHGFKALGEVSLRRARIGGLLYCAHATFENPGATALAADGLAISGRAFLGEWFSAKGAVLLRDATIAGDLYCVGGIYQNPACVALDADRIRVGGSILMRSRFLAQGEVRLAGATIGGNLDCTNGRFEHRGEVAITAANSTIGRDIILGSGFRADGTVCLDGARVGGELDADYATCDGITTVGAVIAGASRP